MKKPEITEAVNAQMPLGATLGIRTFGDAEEVDATLEFSPDLCTSGGALHGGVLMTLADTAGARVRVPEPAGRSADGHDRVEDELPRRGS